MHKTPDYSMYSFLKDFAQTMIAVIIITIFFAVVSIIPGGENFAEKIFVESLGNVEIFGNCIEILQENDWNELTNTSGHSLLGIIEQFQQGANIKFFISSILAVWAKSVFDAFIIGTCYTIFKSIISHWTLLCNVLGITVGVFITELLSKANRNLSTYLYPIVTIIILLIGIGKVIRCTKYNGAGHYYTKPEKASLFLVDVLRGVFIVLCSVMYASMLCLAACHMVPWSLLIVYICGFLLILLGDCAVDMLKSKRK